MSYRIDAATKEEWAERALAAEAKLAQVAKELDRCLKSKTGANNR